MQISVFHRAFLCVVALLSPLAFAGSVLIVATDADDHGSATTSANQEGWLFIQKSLEATAANATNGHKTVVCLGCNGQVAVTAFASAFDKSSLPAAGWSRKTVASAADLTTFFSATAQAGATNVLSTGIVYMPSDRINALGGLTEAQLDIINSNFSALVNHVQSGGGLFTLVQSGVANGYGWLKSAVPGIAVETAGLSNTGGLNGTPALAAFSGLTLSLLGGGEHAHAYFTPPFGGLLVLGEAPLSAPGAPIGDQPKVEPLAVVVLGGVNVNFAAADPQAPSGLGNTQQVPVNTPFGLLALVGALCAFARRALRQQSR